MDAPDRRTPVSFPTSGPEVGVSWHDYFAGMRHAREGGSEDVPPVTRTVWRRSRPVEAAEKFLGVSVRKVLKVVRGAEWPLVELSWSQVYASPEYYAADSTKKPGEEAPAHRRGDLKKPAHETRHWFLRAANPAGKVAFAVHWQEGVTPSGRRSFGFQGAIAVDPFGMPTELRADYTVGNLPRVADEPGHVYESRLALAEAAARRRDREYNDRREYLNRRPLFTGFKDFEAWLAEAVAIAEGARLKAEREGIEA